MVVNPYRSQESRPIVVGVTDFCQPSSSSRHHGPKSVCFSTRLIIIILFSCVAIVSYIFHIHHAVALEHDNLADHPKKQLLRGTNMANTNPSGDGTTNDIQESKSNDRREIDIAISKSSSPAPIVKPAISPTASPTLQPTPTPTASPTLRPTLEPTASPTPQPTLQPTNKPTPIPSHPPTAAPTFATPTELTQQVPKISVQDQNIKHNHAKLIAAINSEAKIDTTTTISQFVIDVSKMSLPEEDLKKTPIDHQLLSDLSENNSHARDAMLDELSHKSGNESPIEPLRPISQSENPPNAHLGRQYHHDNRIIPIHPPADHDNSPERVTNVANETPSHEVSPIEPLTLPGGDHPVLNPITGFDIPAGADKLKTKSQLESANAKKDDSGAADKIDYCASQEDPFESQPVESFTPPKSAPFESVLEWKKAVKDMLKTVSRLQIGGEPLRKRIQEEVDKLRVTRFKTFCKYA